MTPLRALLGLLPLLLVPPRAAGVEVTVQLRLPAAGVPPAPFKATGHAVWFGTEKVAPVDFALETGKPATVTLRPGRWVLRADAPAHWGAPFELAAGEGGSPVTLDLWPAGIVEGGFSLGEEVRPPARLSAFFRPAPGAAAPSPPTSKTDCVLERDLWRCTVPAGSLDLRFQAPGFIPRYLWGVQVAPGATVRPGRLDLRQGSAVQGWVVTADRQPLGEGTRVTLRPRLSGPIQDPGERKRLESLHFEAPVNGRGFFQVEGVPPGAYLIEARHPRYAPALSSIRVVPGQVTEVVSPPLLLDLPKTVEVFVDPPLDPAGQSWSLRLQRLDKDSSVVDTLFQEPVAADGSWRKAGVTPGQYLLRILRGDGETWWTESLGVGENPAPAYIRMDVVTVKGRVLFGRKPLAAARIVLGGRFGASRIEAQSDDKGRFEVFLPRPGAWPVYVSADEPKVEREFPRIKIQPPAGKHVADLELKLPNTVLRGTVVDEQNVPIPQAIVTAMSDGEVQEEQVQERTDAEGKFEFRGLLPGPALLQADAGEDRVADPTSIDVKDAEDSDLKSWILIARPRLRISGTVVSPAGPVPGARVKAAPAGLPYIGVRSVTSDAQGRFELRLPRKTQEILVSLGAPGFTYRMRRLPVPENRTLTLGLEQTGGTLVVQTEHPLDLTDPNAPMVYLLHQGAVEPLPALLGWAASAGAPHDGSARMIVPNLEPGAYQACLVLPSEWAGLSFGVLPKGRCAGGFLSANGELALSVPGGSP
jgi:hypothetical protein